MLGEKARWFGFWTLDGVRGGQVRKYFNQIQKSYKHGTSIAETEEKIRKLIAHAQATTDFYKDIDPETPLEKMPVVNKDTFRNHYEAFRSSMYRDAKDNRTMSTSGSTGTPLTMIQNKDKINHNTAGAIFLSMAGGYYIGMKEAFIRVWVNNVKKGKLQLMMENLIMMDSSHMDDEAIEDMLQVIEKKKVQVMVGYSSAFEQMSRYIERTGRSMAKIHMAAIIPISESMAPILRKQLQNQFHCPVRAWYSNEENGIMGLQDAVEEGYHIDTESYYYEILKMDSDEPAEEGEIGRIVITDLYNYAFPIIRYDNGDTAVARRLEKNGRYKLYLSELYGRRSDMIYDCYGKSLTPYIITNNLWDVKGVKQFRFIQEGEREYTLLLNGDKEQMDLEDITGRICPYLGESASLKVEFVDEIPVLASGKRKYIENRWKAGNKA